MLLRYLNVVVCLSVALAGLVVMTMATSSAAYAEGECETVILKDLCDKSKGSDIRTSGVMEVLKLAIRVLSGLVGAAAIAALVYAGILYSSAGDNSQQISSAKDMIRNTIIGIVSYALMFFGLNWLIPGGVIG